MRIIDEAAIDTFGRYLIEDEKAPATQEKYLRDIERCGKWADGRPLDKTLVLEYKQYLQTIYAPASVNSILSSLNTFFNVMGWHELHLKTIRIQRQVFLDTDKELTKQEYERLLRAARAKKQLRLFWMIQSICSTGVRVSELSFITLEAVRKGYADITCKGKRRQVWLPDNLCRELKTYCHDQNITKGSVFVTRSGRPVEYLGENEETVPCGRRARKEGLPAQSASPFCQNALL